MIARADPSFRPAAAALEALAAERILVMDSAMGTMIQAAGPTEEDFRGDAFARHDRALQGDNDLLNLTRPDIVRGIHDANLAAGADILKANTFNANAISQADYGLAYHAAEIARAGTRIARDAADAAMAADPARRVFVAGVLGPTNRTASISPDVNDPGYRNVTFDELVAIYRENVDAVVAGGADLVLVETVFDTLNAKAALFAVEDSFEALGFRLPVIVSGTITDRSGRTLSGQTVEAFWTSVQHIRPFAIGLNCALGAEQLAPFVADLSSVAAARVSVHPNAGLPNAFGGYDETPEQTAAFLGAWARDGLVNVVGGCCGTTPEHIAAIRAAVDGIAPRRVPDAPASLSLSGLEPFHLAA
ncbi:MAG: homocysteine S-methyltransferase family protein [Rhodospirillaceae bacterium]|nr:homocysteine S-methyltransferase family protein [Rhodospirillaceae bacterium]